MAKGVLRTSRSLRTLRKINTKGKRYQFGKVSSLQDLRTFFYEFSLFTGDIMALPGMPNFSTVNNIRHNLLVYGRIMGDANSVIGTLKKFSTGDTSIEGAGERIFRRAGGRLTGKILLQIPGSNIFSRSARSVVGANMQKQFDGMTKRAFRHSGVKEKPIVHVVGGFDAALVANHIEGAIGMVTEDVIRQVYPFVPVVSGRLRGTLRADVIQNKAIGSTMPSGVVTIGDETTQDYHAIVEYGSGKGFNVGAKALDRYFPIPANILALKNSAKNRTAVNSRHGKGAMMRRGTRNTIERFKRSAGNVGISTTNPEVEAKKLRS